MVYLHLYVHECLYVYELYIHDLCFDARAFKLQTKHQVEHNYADSPRCHLLNVSKLAQALGELEDIGFVEGGGHELASRAQYNVNIADLEVLKQTVLKHAWTTYDHTIEEIQTFKKVRSSPSCMPAP